MKLLSAFAAADAFERDRETIRRALRHVPADAHENGQPRWRLPTILRALDVHFGRRAPAEMPPMHLGALYAKLDALYAKMSSAKTTAQARQILRGEFIPTLHETTRAMMAAYDSDHSFIIIQQHEHTQLATIRKACGWTMDQIMSEYNAATDVDGEDAVEADEADDTPMHGPG